MTRTIIAQTTGGPDVLQLGEAAELVAGPGELLVETAAVGVNFVETYQRSGLYTVPFPFTPGEEASGRVLAVGEGVAGFAVGDLVTTSEARATYAERFLVDAARAVSVPAGIDAETAAAIPLQGLTAHYLATSAAQPQPGETVLVHAGAGGVGLLLTQLLTARGVRVITTASTPEKHALSREAGAAEVLPYAGFAEAVRDLTDGAGVSVVYDGVGRDTFDDSLRALRVRGTLVLFGAASGPVPPFDLQRLNAGGSLSVTRPSLGHFLQSSEERAWRYGELFAAIAAGQLQLRIGARFPLEEAAAAHRALEGRATTGKVILLP
ncbi:quinone oxidoreductase family protein [Leucobacter chromiireducens]|uniref:Quinone oxidoreductase n=1 Tax=Leucobacter chromiireducens subsp. solipictus TaxID=398235 RepID=A0ABS1SIJ5_9MICO|nr:quinone oxidoreductase [Leucobacter chromiireducens]MBL3680389.1 quinone oxidoreductase [Leucobacter chromiireducens subsp. solipictus]